MSKVPKLRFKEFNEKWGTNFIGDVFEITAGGDIDLNHVSQTKDEKFKYPIYANAEKDKGFYGYSDLFKIQAGAITVAGRGVNMGIAHARDHEFYPIVRLLVLLPKKETNILFFEYGINRLNLFVESTGVPQLTVPQISKYKIVF
ncbi:MAG: restriction endonuclease subunit S, partial [Cyclobacteriaceae bacterium]